MIRYCFIGQQNRRIIKTIVKVMKYVKEGNKMKRPDDCPDILFDLMSECWHIVPDERPTFLQICQRLVGDANERFRRTSFFHTPEGREAVINQEEMLQVGVGGGENKLPCLM